MYGWSISVGPGAIQPGRAKTPVSGLLSGTLVATENGWQRVENLQVGQNALTFDGGQQKILRIDTFTPWADTTNGEAARRLIAVPEGCIGNSEDLVFLPGQGLLLECENAQDAMGDPFAVVPAAALEGVCGIAQTQARPEMVLHALRFARDEVVYIDSGLLAFCRTDRAAGKDAGASRYDIRSVKDARALLTDLDLAELALREADEEFFGEMASERVA